MQEGCTQPVPKAVNHSGFYDKHSCPQRESIPGPRTLQSDKMRARRIRMMTICGSPGPICRSVITVGLRLGLEFGLGFGLGLGLLIVVYKLLEKVTKCGSITRLKLTNGVPPRRSTFCHVSHDTDRPLRPVPVSLCDFKITIHCHVHKVSR